MSGGDIRKSSAASPSVDFYDDATFEAEFDGTSYEHFDEILVRSVNDVFPDESGNIELPMPNVESIVLAMLEKTGLVSVAHETETAVYTAENGEIYLL